MKAIISNFRGVASATLDLTRIALLAGINGAGKSSTAQALAAALTGDALPLKDFSGKNVLLKAQAGSLVRSGTAAGRIELTTEAGTTEIKWPSAAVKTTGQPPAASEFAAGLRSIISLPDKERIQILTTYLKATPTKDDLVKKLAPMALGETVVDKLWDLIEKTGWDGAYAQIKEKGAKLKGQWEQITNDNYGDRKAESWIPEGYEPSLDGASSETLMANLTDARDQLEIAIASSAVDDAKKAQLEEEAAQEDVRRQALEEAKAIVVSNEEVEEARRQLQEARSTVVDAVAFRDKKKASLEPGDKPLPPDTMFCPKCKTHLYVKGDQVKTLAEVGASQPNLLDTAAIEKEISGLNEKIAGYEKIRDDLETKAKAASEKNLEEHGNRTRAIQAAEAELKKSTDAKAELAKLAEIPKSDLDVEQCRGAVTMAETRLSAFTAKNSADRVHASIGQNQELLGHIAPEGIRGDVLAAALKGFNATMAKFAAVAGYGPVELTNDFSATYNGTPYYLLSESEQFRVRLILQLAMAKIDGSQAVIVDRADMLDKKGRNGLFKALHAAGLPALVCMTFLDNNEAVPNLAKARLGVTYWLGDGGVAREIV